MVGDIRDDKQPTRGEQVGGIIGCVALALALVLLLWLSGRGLMEAATRR